MKKLLIITFVIGAIINILVNLFIPKDSIYMLMFLYIYYPICFFGVGAVLNYFIEHGGFWISTVATLPFFLCAIGLIFKDSNYDLYSQWIYRTPLLAILVSIMILEYKIYKLFHEDE